MKIVSEKQLTYIKAEYQDLTNHQVGNYFFEGSDKSIFENLILFTDDVLFSEIRNYRYLAMTNGQRIWNKYFWYLHYQTDILRNGGNADSYQQSISKVLEAL